MSQLLIMEDDIVDQMALLRMLNKKFTHLEICLCNNVAETITKLKTGSFCWIISDFNLPDGTIIDILPYINKAKLICVSGQLEKEEISTLNKNGLHKLLIKDQQLEYLKTIEKEIGNDNAPEAIQTNANQIEDFSNYPVAIALTHNFGDDLPIKIEVLEMFETEVYTVQIPALLHAIKEKDLESLRYLSHKLQSTFRVLGAQEVLTTLINWEKILKGNSIDWIVFATEVPVFEKKVEIQHLAAQEYLQELNQQIKKKF